MDRVRSGIGVVEESWGGLRRGGLYLLCGPPTETRQRLALDVVRAAVAEGERCLLATLKPADTLAALAAPLGFDLRRAAAQGTLRLLPPAEADSAGPAGGGIHGLTAIIRQDLPERLVVDDLNAIVPGEATEAFELALLHLLVTLDEAGTTAVLVLDEPARTRPALRLLHEHSEGTILIRSDGSLALETEQETASGEAAWRLHLDRLARPFGVRGPSVASQGSDDAPVGNLADDRASGAAPLGVEREQAPLHLRPHGSAPPERAPTGGDAFDEAALPGVRFLDLSGVLPARGMEPAPAPEPAPRRLGRGQLVGHVAAPEPPDFTEDPFMYVRPSRDACTASRGLLPFLTVPAPGDPDHTDPAAFVAAFDAAARAWEERDQSFLALGLQLPRDHSEARLLTLLRAGLAIALRESDRLLVDEERRCVAAVLVGRRPGWVPVLLQHLAALLEAGLGSGAASALATTQVTAAPNGYPFRTGDAFLQYLIGTG